MKIGVAALVQTRADQVNTRYPLFVVFSRLSRKALSFVGQEQDKNSMAKMRIKYY